MDKIRVTFTGTATFSVELNDTKFEIPINPAGLLTSPTSRTQSRLAS